MQTRPHRGNDEVKMTDMGDVELQPSGLGPISRSSEGCSIQIEGDTIPRVVPLPHAPSAQLPIDARQPHSAGR